MKIYLFDTLSKKKKEVIPRDDPNVRNYPFGHIGRSPV